MNLTLRVRVNGLKIMVTCQGLYQRVRGIGFHGKVPHDLRNMAVVQLLLFLKRSGKSVRADSLLTHGYGLHPVKGLHRLEYPWSAGKRRGKPHLPPLVRAGKTIPASLPYGPVGKQVRACLNHHVGYAFHRVDLIQVIPLLNPEFKGIGCHIAKAHHAWLPPFQGRRAYYDHRILELMSQCYLLPDMVDIHTAHLKPVLACIPGTGDCAGRFTDNRGNRYGL